MRLAPVWLLLFVLPARGEISPSQADVEWDTASNQDPFDPTIWVYLIRDEVTKERWGALSDADRAALLSLHEKEAHNRGGRLLSLVEKSLRDDLSLEEVADAASKIREQEDWMTGTRPRSQAVNGWLKSLDIAASNLEEHFRSLPLGGDPAAREAADRAFTALKGSQASRMAADPQAAASGFDGSARGGQPGGVPGVRDQPGSGDEAARIDEEKRRRLAEGSVPPTGEEARRKELIDRIVSRTVSDGIPPVRRAESERLRREELADVPVDVLERMDADRSHMVLVPEGKGIGDMPGANERRLKSFPLSLFGCTEPVPEIPLTTLDGRKLYKSNSAGIADVPQPDGSFACYAKLDPARKKWPQAEVEIHEWGHMIHRNLGASDRAEIRRLYESAHAGLFPFSDDYAAVNEREYFAVATEIWFGVHDQDGVHKEPEWIRRNQPDLARLLERVYGPPRLAAAPMKG